jgi:hypothetical protein
MPPSKFTKLYRQGSPYVNLRGLWRGGCALRFGARAGGRQAQEAGEQTPVGAMLHLYHAADAHAHRGDAVERAFHRRIAEHRAPLAQRTIPRRGKAFRTGALAQLVGRDARHADAARCGIDRAGQRKQLQKLPLPIRRPPVMPRAGEGDGGEGDGEGFGVRMGHAREGNAGGGV